MICEIISAKAEQGLLENTNGFCPVAITRDIEPELLKPLTDLATKQAKRAKSLRQNGGNFFSHFPLVLKGNSYNLLTRGTSDDDSYVVHQILVDHWDRKTAGPAAVLNNNSIWITKWSADPQFLSPRVIETLPLSPRICSHWNAIKGDPGWAGLLVDLWEKKKTCALLTPGEMETEEVLSLIVESQSLIPHDFRWQIPFSIGAWHPFKGNRRFWLAFERGTQAELDAMQQSQTVCIDLGDKTQGISTNKYSEHARNGSWIRFDSPDFAPESRKPAMSNMIAPADSRKIAFKPKHENKTSADVKLTSPKVGSKSTEAFRADTRLTDKQIAEPSMMTKFGSRLVGTFQQTNWVKLSIIGVLALLLGGIAWWGKGILESAMEAINSNSTPPPIVKLEQESPPVEPVVKSENEPPVENKQQPVVQDNSKSLLSREMVRAALAKVKAPFDLKLDSQESQQIMVLELAPQDVKELAEFWIEGVTTNRDFEW